MIVASIRCTQLTEKGRRCRNRIAAERCTDDCGVQTARPGAAWAPAQRAAPSIRYEERHSPRRSRDVEPRIPRQRTPPRPPVSRPEPVLPDSVYELGYRICVDGWQEAVAWRLAGALDRRAWNAFVKRPSGLCRLLADLATEIEDTATAMGEAAGLACAEAMRWFGAFSRSLTLSSRMLNRVHTAISLGRTPWPTQSRTRSTSAVISACSVGCPETSGRVPWSSER